MTFWIGFDEASGLLRGPDGGVGVSGRIVLGASAEAFEADIGWWNTTGYRQQWLAALTRVSREGLASCLITSVSSPESARGVARWLMYPDGESVVFQEQILLTGWLHAVGFDPSRPFESIPPRTLESDGDYPISEWVLSLADVVDFMRELESSLFAPE